MQFQLKEAVLRIATLQPGIELPRAIGGKIRLFDGLQQACAARVEHPDSCIQVPQIAFGPRNDLGAACRSEPRHDLRYGPSLELLQRIQPAVEIAVPDIGNPSGNHETAGKQGSARAIEYRDVPWRGGPAEMQEFEWTSAAVDDGPVVDEPLRQHQCRSTQLVPEQGPQPLEAVMASRTHQCDSLPVRKNRNSGILECGVAKNELLHGMSVDDQLDRLAGQACDGFQHALAMPSCAARVDDSDAAGPDDESGVRRKTAIACRGFASLADERIDVRGDALRHEPCLGRGSNRVACQDGGQHTHHHACKQSHVHHPKGRRAARQPERGFWSKGAMIRALALVLLTGLSIGSGAEPVPALEMLEIAPGNHVHYGQVAERTPENMGDNANIGFIVGSECVLAVDTGGSFPVGQALREAIRRVTDRRVCYVVLTHVHPDHFFGATAFLEDRPQLIAHENYPPQLAARARPYLASLRRDLGDAAMGTGLAQPTLLVKDRLEIDLGGRKVQVQAWPTAHTDNDLTLLDEKTRTLWLSDLLFVDHTPVIDGSITGFLSVMDRLQMLQASSYVPGHGRPVLPWPQALGPQRRYFSAILQGTRTALRARKTLQEATDEVAHSEAGQWALFELFHRRNVTAAYTELEWE